MFWQGSLGLGTALFWHYLHLMYRGEVKIRMFCSSTYTAICLSFEFIFLFVPNPVIQHLNHSCNSNTLDWLFPVFPAVFIWNMTLQHHHLTFNLNRKTSAPARPATYSMCIIKFLSYKSIYKVWQKYNVYICYMNHNSKWNVNIIFLSDFISNTNRLTKKVSYLFMICHDKAYLSNDM